MQSLQVDTDHGAYDALPTREYDYAPAGAILTVICEDGAVAGFVLPVEMESVYYLGITARGVLTATVFGTPAGAVSAVAAHDAGITL